MVLPGLPVCMAPFLVEATAVGKCRGGEKQCADRCEEHLECCFHDYRLRHSPWRFRNQEASYCDWQLQKVDLPLAPDKRFYHVVVEFE